MMYLYAISHRNLPVHQQAIQGAHAQLEYTRLHGHTGDHPTYIWLTVANKLDLLLLQTMLESKGIYVCEFHDLDFNGYDPSAISCLLKENQRYLLSDLPLWKCAPPKNKSILGKIWDRLNHSKPKSQPQSLEAINVKDGKVSAQVTVNGKDVEQALKRAAEKVILSA
jgi:hypothetical protein